MPDKNNTIYKYTSIYKSINKIVFMLLEKSDYPKFINRETSWWFYIKLKAKIEANRLTLKFKLEIESIKV